MGYQSVIGVHEWFEITLPLAYLIEVDGVNLNCRSRGTSIPRKRKGKPTNKKVYNKAPGLLISEQYLTIVVSLNTKASLTLWVFSYDCYLSEPINKSGLRHTFLYFRALEYILKNSTLHFKSVNVNMFWSFTLTRILSENLSPPRSCIQMDELSCTNLH